MIFFNKLENAILVGFLTHFVTFLLRSTEVVVSRFALGFDALGVLVAFSQHASLCHNQLSSPLAIYEKWMVEQLNENQNSDKISTSSQKGENALWKAAIISWKLLSLFKNGNP